MKDRVAWGVLGGARIAVGFMLPAIQLSRRSRLQAVGSRRPGVASRIAVQLGAGRHYDDYQAVLEDDLVDAVYIALPNSMHAEWTVRAVEAGKAVLCEKPLTLSLAEAQQVAAAAEGEGVLVAEAFMYRHHPQIGFLHDLLRRGVLGTPSVCRASLHFVLEDRTGDIRARPELGGGALLDIGCYALDAMRTVFDASPRSARGTAEFGSTGVDEVVAAVLSYADGRVGLMDVGFRLPWLQAPLQVVGDEGQCTLVNAFNPGSGATEAHVLRQGRRQVVKRFPGFDMWLAMVDAVAATLLDGQPYPYDLAASVETMAALELVRTALGPSGC